MEKSKTRDLTTAGLLIAVGILLPYIAAHGLGIPGTVLLPMHIPVLLAGFLCGPLFGALCGVLIPVLSSLLTGMPAAFPMLPIMAGELLTYGLVGGLLFRKTALGTKRWGIFAALPVAMLCGRAVYAGIFWLLSLSFGALKALPVWAAIVTGLPGIVVQLLLIPTLVISLQFGFYRRQKDALDSAVNLIRQGAATCVVIKNNVIVKTEYGSGIAPVIRMYESGILSGAVVADKIVGRAAAMILVLGGASACYGETMSEGAREYLQTHHIDAAFGACVKTIVNRSGDGECPMEATVAAVENPEEGLALLKKKIEELKAGR